MDTHHHTVSLRVKSVLDSCGGNEGLNKGDDEMQELEASQQVRVTTARPRAAAVSDIVARCLLNRFKLNGWASWL